MNSKRKKRNEYSNEAPERGTGKKRPPQKITPEGLHNAGLYYLQRFAASRAGFRRAMLRRVRKSCMTHKDQDYEACAAMVEALIAKFEDLGLLNDPGFAEGQVSFMRRQGKSRRAIDASLRLKGIEEELALRTLESHDIEEHENAAQAEFHAALIFARKRKLGPFRADTLPGRKKQAPEQIFDKSMATMARAGFSMDTARRILAMPNDEAQALLASSRPPGA
jgi:regulatory protein